MSSKLFKMMLFKGENIESVSKKLGINRDTLSRHLKNEMEKMPLGEERKIAALLGLSDEEIMATFFK